MHSADSGCSASLHTIHLAECIACDITHDAAELDDDGRCPDCRPPRCEDCGQTLKRGLCPHCDRTDSYSEDHV